MSIYKMQEWIDHIEDIETGELLQEGTLYCARLMNHMEKGIYDAHIEINDLWILIKALDAKIKILEDSLINNMPHNNFLEDLTSLDNVVVHDGIYNKPLARIGY